ncbi:hypothetical protein Gotri_006825, partial [Gossypium trilobum]|nr:hypothetical protein [Gossypium trilobum]
CDKLRPKKNIVFDVQPVVQIAKHIEEAIDEIKKKLTLLTNNMNRSSKKETKSRSGGTMKTHMKGENS